MSKYSALINSLKGPVYSIITPFKKDDQIDFDALEKYLLHLNNCGAKIFYAMAFNSRYSQLTHDEILELNKFIIKTVKSINPKNIIIVADPVTSSTKESLLFSEQAQRHGADLISLIFSERIYSHNQVYNHFDFISKKCSLPILLHEMKLVSGLDGSLVNWDIELLKDVMSIENLIAIKEDAKDENIFKKILKIEFNGSIIISGGGKKRWISYSNTSCQSWLNGIGTFLPKIPKLFWENYLDGNSKFLTKIINEIEEPFFNEIVNKFGWHTSARASLYYFGHMKIYERMPMTYLDNNQYNEVKNFFDKMKLEEFI